MTEDCIPMIEYSQNTQNSNHSSPQQTLLGVPREQWRNDSGVQSLHNSYDYDHSGSGEVYPPPQIHQENFIQHRKFESPHHPR